MTDGVVLILTSYADELKRQRLDNTPMLNAVYFSNYAEFVAKADVVMQFITETFKNTAQQRKMAALMARLLLDNLEKAGMDRTLRSCMSHTHRLQSIFHHNFPGYWQNGFMGLIVKDKQ